MEIMQMGDETTHVAENSGAHDWVRELSTEISAVRRRLDALVKDLDRRCHDVTGWRNHRRPRGR